MPEKVSALLPSVLEIATAAGEVTLPYFQQGREALDLKQKPDKTPLTAADLAAHQFIERKLKQLTPELPILSEEGVLPAFEERQKWETYWLVDPLDGTRGFVHGSKEYTVNIALIEKKEPILGVIYAPVLDLCYYAVRGEGSFKKSTSSADATPLVSNAGQHSKTKVVLGRYLRKTQLLSLYERESDAEIVRLNSSLKFCELAEGNVDLYPRLGKTGEWDTAAGQCILEEAGGGVFDFDGKTLRYNARVSVINPPFIALSEPTRLREVIEFISKTRGDTRG